MALAAAFGRLCVETKKALAYGMTTLAAAFGRLCVETVTNLGIFRLISQPPSGGCVLKHYQNTDCIIKY